MNIESGPTTPTKQTLKRRVAALYRGFRSPPRAGELVALMYHSIQPNHPESTSPETFARHLETLVDRFAPTPLTEWLSGRAGGARPAAVVTFDDGFENNHRYALPVLRRLGVPAVVFVATGFVEGGCGVERRLDMYRDLPAMSWGQIRELHQAGVEIGSHTHRHLDLGAATRSEIADELVRSRALLEDQLRAPVTLFAYPWGQRRNLGRDTPDLLREHGFIAACSTLWGRNTARTDRYRLRRIRIDPWDTPQDFDAKISGHWDFVIHVQNWR